MPTGITVDHLHVVKKLGKVVVIMDRNWFHLVVNGDNHISFVNGNSISWKSDLRPLSFGNGSGEDLYAVSV